MKTNIKYAMTIMFFAFAYIVGITFFPVTVTGNEHAKTVVGFILGTAFSTLIGYYWGSSKTRSPEFPESDKTINTTTTKSITTKEETSNAEPTKTE